MELFGFQIKRKAEGNNNIPSFVQANEEDGSVNIAATGTGVSSFLDMDGTAKSEAELVQKYRTMLQQPEVSQAVDDIVNEAICISHDAKVVECITDDVDLSDGIKKKIREEFDTVLKLLDFSNNGYELFQKWYVDGRINYHVMIDNTAPRKGIQELRYIDPRKIRKVREFEKEKVGNNNENQLVTKKVKNEYFIYSEKGFNNMAGIAGAQQQQTQGNATMNGLKIAKDSIVTSNSGLLNETSTLVLSHMHKAYKPLNQLRMMEDSLVIYRISRAPERRIFYIDVGNLPKGKAEEYLRNIMNQYRNKLVYDAQTGDIKDDKKHMSMLEDFFLPRREGGRGTEISTLPGGENLGQIDDIIYFQKKLYKALNVPVNRLDQENQFSLGRSTEISRDEVKFKKFIDRLRKRFSDVFMQALKTQLLLKGIITLQDWEEWKESIVFDFIEDNYFSELKESEMIRERFDLISSVDEYVGKYVSNEWVRKNILRQTDDDIEEMGKQIEQEKADEPDDEDDDLDY